MKLVSSMTLGTLPRVFFLASLLVLFSSPPGVAAVVSSRTRSSNSLASFESGVEKHAGSWSGHGRESVAEVPKMWPESPAVGSVTVKQATNTEKVVIRGLPAPKVVIEPPVSNNLAKLKALDCDAMDDKRVELEKEYEELKVHANEDAFEVTRLQATATRIAKETAGKNFSPRRDLAEKNAASLGTTATREMNRYKEVEMELLYVMEQYGLKCGVRDKYCTKAGKDVNQFFVDLQSKKANLATSMTEAGWLKAEAEGFLTKKETAAKAQAKFEAAWTEARALFEDEQRLSWLVMIKAAACGLRPPASPWSSPATGCDMRPEDPEMKKLMKNDPVEFRRRWKEEIGRAAGVRPEYVRVDSDCLGNIPN